MHNRDRVVMGVGGHDMSGVFVCVCMCAESASEVGELV